MMMKTKRGGDGVARIAAERRRQVIREGFGSLHDDRQRQGELARAAACYAMGMCEIYMGEVIHPAVLKVPVLREPEPVWPFDEKLDKRDKHSRIRQLEIAGALIAAEIDRLLRGGHGRNGN